MFYLDTSVVVTFLTLEPASVVTKEWLAAHQDSDFAVSEWVGTEFLSALSTKTRLGRLTLPEAAGAERLYQTWREQVIILEFRNSFFADADRYLRLRTTSLRASDALHLAIAASVSATLCTRDRRFADAAAKIGRAV